MAVPTILVRGQRPLSLAERSKREDAVFVDLYTGWVCYGGQRVKCPVAVRRVMLYLLAAGDRPVGSGELTDLMYGDREDGGPDNAQQVVRRYAFDARTAASAIGLLIRTHGNSGWTVEAPKAKAA